MFYVVAYRISRQKYMEYKEEIENTYPPEMRNMSLVPAPPIFIATNQGLVFLATLAYLLVIWAGVTVITIKSTVSKKGAAFLMLAILAVIPATTVAYFTVPENIEPFYSYAKEVRHPTEYGLPEHWVAELEENPPPRRWWYTPEKLGIVFVENERSPEEYDVYISNPIIALPWMKKREYQFVIYNGSIYWVYPGFSVTLDTPRPPDYSTIMLTAATISSALILCWCVLGAFLVYKGISFVWKRRKGGEKP